MSSRNQFVRQTIAVLLACGLIASLPSGFAVRGGEKLAQSGRFEIGSGVMGLTVT
jgi:hypothetical protein